MSDNLVVDVSSINAMISKVRQFTNEASQRKYFVKQWGSGKGAWSSPLHMSSDMQDFRLEAIVISSDKSNWAGWDRGRTLTLNINKGNGYQFLNDFKMMPVISVTYDGNIDGVTVRIDATKDIVKISLTKPTGIWKNASFLVHLIALGY